MSQTKTRGFKEVIPFAFMVTVGFFIAGFVTYAFYNGVTEAVFPPAYSNNWTFIAGWLAVWVVVGLLIGFYMGRK